MVLPSWPSRIFGSLHDSRRSRTRTGVPFCALTTRGADVVRVCIKPTARTLNACCAALDEAAAGIDIVRGQRLLHLAERQSVGNQLAGINLHLVFARRPAEDSTSTTFGTDFNCLTTIPVLERLQFHHVILRIRAWSV